MIPCKDCLVLAICKQKGYNDIILCDILFRWLYNLDDHSYRAYHDSMSDREAIVKEYLPLWDDDYPLLISQMDYRK